MHSTDDRLRQCSGWSAYADFTGALIALDMLSDGQVAHAEAARLQEENPIGVWKGIGLCYAYILESLAEEISGDGGLLGLGPDYAAYEARRYMESRFRPNSGETPAQAVLGNLQLLQERLKEIHDGQRFDEAMVDVRRYVDYVRDAHETAILAEWPGDAATWRTRLLRKWFGSWFLGAHAVDHYCGQMMANLDAPDVSHQPATAWRDSAYKPNSVQKTLPHGFAAIAGLLAKEAYQDTEYDETIQNEIASVERLVDFNEIEVHVRGHHEKFGLMEDWTAPEGFEIVRESPASADQLNRLTEPLGPIKAGHANIAALFRQRPVRLIVSGHMLLGVALFRPTILGLVMMAKNHEERAEVIRITHEDDLGVSYSYALYFPCSGGYWNAGEFWLFHKIGGRPGGTSEGCEAMIQEWLRRLADDIELKEAEIPDSPVLQTFLMSRPLGILTERVRRHKVAMNEARGSLGELVVAELLRRQGASNVEVQRKLKSLDNQEIDCLSIDDKRRRIELIEVKTVLEAMPVSHWNPERDGSLEDVGLDEDDAREPDDWHDNDTVRQLLRIRDLVEHAAATSICEEMGVEGYEVVFRVVATGDLRGDPARRLNIPIMTPDEFIEACQRADLPRAYHRVLDSMRDFDVEDDHMNDIDILETLLETKRLQYR